MMGPTCGTMNIRFAAKFPGFYVCVTADPRPALPDRIPVPAETRPCRLIAVRSGAMEAGTKMLSTPAHKRHLGRHHRHGEDVGVQGQAGHVDNRIGDMGHVHDRPDWRCGDRPGERLSSPRSFGLHC